MNTLSALRNTVEWTKTKQGMPTPDSLFALSAGVAEAPRCLCASDYGHTAETLRRKGYTWKKVQAWMASNGADFSMQAIISGWRTWSRQNLGSAEMNPQTDSALREMIETLLSESKSIQIFDGLVENAEAFARALIARCTDLVIVPRSSIADNGIAVAAAFIQKKADEYAYENCSTEHDTGMPTYHYGKSGMAYHHTLTELAEEIAILAATQPTAQEK